MRRVILERAIIIGLLLWALVILALLTSCAPHAVRPVVVPIHAETDGKLRVLVGESHGTALIVVPQDKDVKDGLKIIGCGTTYVCTPDRAGVLYVVTKVQK
jgi:hypothetical protein